MKEGPPLEMPHEEVSTAGSEAAKPDEGFTIRILGIDVPEPVATKAAVVLVATATAFAQAKEALGSNFEVPTTPEEGAKEAMKLLIGVGGGAVLLGAGLAVGMRIKRAWEEGDTHQQPSEEPRPRGQGYKDSREEALDRGIGQAQASAPFVSRMRGASPVERLEALRDLENPTRGSRKSLSELT